MSKTDSFYDSNANVQNGPLLAKSGRHPFLYGCSNMPTDKDDKVEELKEWLKKQPHLPQLTYEHLILFLHSNYYDIETTKSTIGCYFNLRSTSPELFANKKTALSVFDITYQVALKKKSVDGYNVLLYRLSNFDPSKVNFVEAVKSFFLFNDVRLSEDGLADGYIVVFDMKGVCLSHLTKLNLNAVRKFMMYIQDCHPARLKGVHVINTVGFFDKILSIVKPLMKSGLIKMLHLHGSDLTQLYKVVSKEALPADYGGNDEHTEILHAKHRRLIETTYMEWLDEEERYVIDQVHKPKMPKKPCMIASTFRSLSID